MVDLFCKNMGVRRQVSEADNQASNGKAERMHQTLMILVRSMIFGSGLMGLFTKTDADVNIERYEARMLACGNEQWFGKDYTLTFAARMVMTKGKVILALK